MFGKVIVGTVDGDENKEQAKKRPLFWRQLLSHLFTVLCGIKKYFCTFSSTFVCIAFEGNILVYSSSSTTVGKESSDKTSFLILYVSLDRNTTSCLKMLSPCAAQPRLVIAQEQAVMPQISTLPVYVPMAPAYRCQPAAPPTYCRVYQSGSFCCPTTGCSTDPFSEYIEAKRLQTAAIPLVRNFPSQTFFFKLFKFETSQLHRCFVAVGSVQFQLWPCLAITMAPDAPTRQPSC